MGKIAIPSPANSIVVTRIAHWYINALKRDTKGISFLRRARLQNLTLQLANSIFLAKRPAIVKIMSVIQNATR